MFGGGDDGCWCLTVLVSGGDEVLAVLAFGGDEDGAMGIGDGDEV